MATTEQITESQTITINPNSKNKTYEFVNNGVEISFNGGFVGDNGQAINGYDKSRYYNVAVKKGDDLVMITLFTKDNGKTKKITTTIKNFFVDSSADYRVKYKSYQAGFGISWVNGSLNPITPNTEESVYGLYGLYEVENDYWTNYLLGTTGKDIFAFTDNYTYHVYDEKGNDEYLSRHSNKRDSIVDLSGNDQYLVDNYLVGNGGILYTYDYSGNDQYTALGTNARLYATDYSGNDIYDIESNASFSIDDYNGKDEYLVLANDSSELADKRINDYKGNDKYHFTQATVISVDQDGKDSWEISDIGDGNSVEITDYAGKDKYVVTNCTPTDYTKLLIGDNKGNDTYEWTNVVYSALSDDGNYSLTDDEGKDKYTFTDVQNMRVLDKDGNDNYTMSGVNKLYLTDNGGNDKYTTTSATSLDIDDLSGKDTYNFYGTYDSTNPVFVNNIHITDRGEEKDTYNLKFVANEYAGDDTESRSIVDFGGNDTYNLQSTSGIRINDKSGNDTYNLKAPTINGKKINFENEEQLASINIKTQIYDDSGNDKYNITHAFNSTIYDSDGEDVYNLKGDTIKINQEIAGEPIELTIPSVYITKINDTSTTSNDTYNIGNMANGELFVLGAAITDAGGDNKFNIKNSGNYFDIKAFYDRMMSGNATIADQLALMYTLPSLTIASTGAGKDKYSVSNSSLFLGITDANGDDSYSFKKVLGNISVQDAEGNDTYKISKNKSFISINDQSGDDAYTIDKLTYSLGLMEGNVIRIKDTSGYDTLKVSSLKESNIVYMANFSKIQDDNYIDNDFGLIIYDSKNGGFIELLDFYEITGANLTGFGDGVIENFKADNKTIDLVNTDACNYALMESLREQVGGWLAENNYDDVEQVLTGNSQQAISDLIQIFQGINA